MSTSKNTPSTLTLAAPMTLPSAEVTARQLSEGADPHEAHAEGVKAVIKQFFAYPELPETALSGVLSRRTPLYGLTEASALWGVNLVFSRVSLGRSAARDDSGAERAQVLRAPAHLAASLSLAPSPTVAFCRLDG